MRDRQFIERAALDQTTLVEIGGADDPMVLALR